MVAPPSALRGRPGLRLLLRSLIVVAFLLIIALSPLLGSVSIPAPIVFRIILGNPDPCAGTSVSPQLCSAYSTIVWQLVLPEIVLALLVGAALGVAGGSLQGVFRNPLADPFLLGISSGAAIGAAVLFVYDVGLAHADLFLPLLAFFGAFATGLVILGIARGRYASIETLLLAGVALAYLLSAVLSLLLLYNPSGAEQVTFWLLGGLGLASWTVDGIVGGAVLVLGTLLIIQGRQLDLVQLGNDVAQSAGVDARRLRVRVILFASMITAVAVAFAGIIGFVGLVSAHIARRIVGTDYRVVLPVAMAIGAIFLLGARDISFLFFPGSVLPIGIFTAMAGVPFFLYLLYRQRRVSTMGAP